MRNGIYATCNLITKKWETTHDKIFPGGGNLIINIIKDNSDESQAAIRLGYNFYCENNLVSSDTFPPVMAKNVVINDAYQMQPSIYFLQDKFHKINFWARVDEDFFDDDLEITDIKPQQPYPSWTFIDGEWCPPIPRPERGIWSWIEETQEWKLIDHDYQPDAAGTLTGPPAGTLQGSISNN